MPFIVVAAFAFSAISGGNSPAPSPGPSMQALGAIAATAPAHAREQTANCTKVLERLPVSLDGKAPRVVHTTPDSPFVVAWGQPATVLSCGVDRPKDLVPGSGADFRGDGTSKDPYYDVTSAGGATIYTTVDRAAYISLRFDKGVQPADHLPTLSNAIAAALPPVCSTDPSIPDPDKLCTRRK